MKLTREEYLNLIRKVMKKNKYRIQILNNIFNNEHKKKTNKSS